MKFRDVLALGRKELKKQPDDKRKEVQAAWVDSWLITSRLFASSKDNYNLNVTLAT